MEHQKRAVQPADIPEGPAELHKLHRLAFSHLRIGKQGIDPGRAHRQWRLELMGDIPDKGPLLLVLAFQPVHRFLRGGRQPPEFDHLAVHRDGAGPLPSRIRVQPLKELVQRTEIAPDDRYVYTHYGEQQHHVQDDSPLEDMFRDRIPLYGRDGHCKFIVSVIRIHKYTASVPCGNILILALDVCHRLPVTDPVVHRRILRSHLHNIESVVGHRIRIWKRLPRQRPYYYVIGIVRKRLIYLLGQLPDKREIEYRAPQSESDEDKSRKAEYYFRYEPHFPTSL